MTFMNNWFRADQRGNPFGYVSAVAVEEKSVIDCNAGNPDGELQEGEEPRPPRVPLVAIYPEEGTLYSDNPLFVLDAAWVDRKSTSLTSSPECASRMPYTSLKQKQEHKKHKLHLL